MLLGVEVGVVVLGVLVGVGDGTAVVVVGLGVLDDGVVGVGVVLVDGVLDGEMGDVVLDDGVLDGGVLDGGVPGGVAVVGSAVVGFGPGPVRGKLDVDPALVCGARGFSGLPTGSDGRALDRDVPSDRSTVGLDEPAACGT